MNSIGALESFAARLRRAMSGSIAALAFNDLALELFALQFEHNSLYRSFCQGRQLSPAGLRRWEQIPAIPTQAFKEWELSCLPAEERSVVFLSSGTTEHQPSRHFHSHRSLEIYEASLLGWFGVHLLPNDPKNFSLRALALTPSPAQAPHSSLVHMFETVQRRLGFAKFSFTGAKTEEGIWVIDCQAMIALLQEAVLAKEPVMLLGTAFSFVHLLDHMAQRNLALRLPAGSRVMETGGYKGRSRALSKPELHSFIASEFGIPRSCIVCEYGMSELSSQAYDRVCWSPSQPGRKPLFADVSHQEARCFRFPSWVRVQIVSPESGQPVTEAQTGLIRVFDLANVYSVMAVQTDDLAVRRGDGFELIGRAELAEARGCSLMAQ
jgi:hypothetical protein